MDDSLRIVLLEDPSRPSTDELRRSLALLGSDVVVVTAATSAMLQLDELLPAVTMPMPVVPMPPCELPRESRRERRARERAEAKRSRRGVR